VTLVAYGWLSGIQQTTEPWEISLVRRLAGTAAERKTATNLRKNSVIEGDRIFSVKIGSGVRIRVEKVVCDGHQPRSPIGVGSFAGSEVQHFLYRRTMMSARNACYLFFAMTLTLLGQGAASAAGPQILFQDDFATLDPSWGEPDSMVHVERNRLVVSPTEGRARAVINQAFAFDDMTAEVTIYNQSPDPTNSNGGLIFWAKDYNDYYVLWISGDGRVGVMRNLNGRWMQPVSVRASELVKRGPGQNQLRVVTQGNSATIFINGQQLLSFKAQAPQGSSFVGLFAEAPGTLEFGGLGISH
jgi:hypothetical protein